MEIIALIPFFIFIFTFFTLLIILWIIGPVSGTYFDAALTKKHCFLPYFYSPFHSRRCMRGGFYLLLLLTDGNPYKSFCKWWPKLFKAQKNTYIDFNYRAIARKRDWLLAIIYGGALLLFFLSAILMCIFGALEK
jgi:hypothetical protein